MKMRTAIALGMAIIVLKVLTPFVYAAFAGMLITFFDTVQNTLNVTASVVQSISVLGASP